MTQPAASPPLVSQARPHRRGTGILVAGIIAMVISPLLFVGAIILGVTTTREPTGLGDLDNGATVHLTGPGEVSILAKDENAPGSPPPLPVTCAVAGPGGQVEVTHDDHRTNYYPHEENRIGYFAVTRTGDYRISCPPFTRLSLLDKSKWDRQVDRFQDGPRWGKSLAQIVGMSGVAMVIIGAARRSASARTGTRP